MALEERSEDQQNSQDSSSWNHECIQFCMYPSTVKILQPEQNLASMANKESHTLPENKNDGRS